MHYGLLPRANRGIFAINELPDLAGKIQVGLFNILQEGDVQIKGYPVRLPLDVMLVFTRQPGGLHGPRQDHHAAQGPHRLARSGRTTPPRVEHGMAITAQEAWIERADSARPVQIPDYMREIVEQVAFRAREDRRIDKRTGVSQRLPISGVRERAVERRAPRADARARKRSCRASGYLCRAALHHRQVRAGVRGRAEGRGDGRPRTDPHGGRAVFAERFEGIEPPHRRVVRAGRHAEDGRCGTGGRAPGVGPATSRASTRSSPSVTGDPDDPAALRRRPPSSCSKGSTR